MFNLSLGGALVVWTKIASRKQKFENLNLKPWSVNKLEEHLSKPQANTTVFDAVIELTGKLKEDFGEFKEKNEEFGEKLNTTFATSQENTMKIQMIENNHRVQQDSFKNLEK